MKRGEIVFTKGSQAAGAMPAVAPEPVRIIRRVHGVTSIPGDEWYLVAFADGGRLTMHASNLRAEVRP